MQAAITWSPIEHAYSGRVVLRTPGAQVQSLGAGRVALLMGPSGSGKSTLLTLMAGLMLPTRGDIAVAGASWRSLAEPARDRHRASTIGVIPQTAHILPTLDVLHNVVLPHYFAHGNISGAKERALALLDSAKLSHRVHAKVHTLSQGETQRVALCRALINRPTLILADEPTANLDDDSAHRTCRLLLQCAHEHGAALVIATHDARVRASVSDRDVMTIGLSPC